MTPVGFVFLTLMFGVIIPSPIDGEIKMTFREAMSMSRSDLEKRQFGIEELLQQGEALLRQRATLIYLICLHKFEPGTGESCDDAKLATRIDEITKKYSDVLQNIPFDVLVGLRRLQCTDKLVCSSSGTCDCPTVPDPKASSPCVPINRDPAANCDGEHNGYRHYFPLVAPSINTGSPVIIPTLNPDDGFEDADPRSPTTTASNPVTDNDSGVRASKSGWYITVMAAIAISRRHVFSP